MKKSARIYIVAFVVFVNVIWIEKKSEIGLGIGI